MEKALGEKFKGRSPFAELLGVQIEQGERGASQCLLEIKAFMLNIHKSVHGGVIYSLADIGMGVALFSLLEAGEQCATIEIKVNYLKPAYVDNLSCQARVIQKGRNIAVLEADVKDNTILIAKALGTFSIFMKKETRSPGEES
jgi:acyl-CoA thioesterase